MEWGERKNVFFAKSMVTYIENPKNSLQKSDQNICLVRMHLSSIIENILHFYMAAMNSQE